MRGCGKVARMATKKSPASQAGKSSAKPAAKKEKKDAAPKKPAAGKKAATGTKPAANKSAKAAAATPKGRGKAQPEPSEPEVVTEAPSPAEPVSPPALAPRVATSRGPAGVSPTAGPTAGPTTAPTAAPPTAAPPTAAPTGAPTGAPSAAPPTAAPRTTPTAAPPTAAPGAPGAAPRPAAPHTTPTTAPAPDAPTETQAAQVPPRAEAPVRPPPDEVPAPPRAPAASSVGPSWTTRPVAFAQFPKSAGLEERYGISFPSVAPDGTIVGLQRGKPSEARVLRIGRDGSSTPLCEPGQLTFATVSADGRSVYGATADAKLVEFPLTGDARQAAVRFEAGARVWSIHPLSPDRVVIAQSNRLQLLATDGDPWRSLESISVAPVAIPMVDVLAGGRWVLVGKVPRVRLFAVIRDRLRVVQSWGPAEGMIVADGRPFLPAPGTPDFLEVLDLVEVHAALS